MKTIAVASIRHKRDSASRTGQATRSESPSCPFSSTWLQAQDRSSPLVVNEHFPVEFSSTFKGQRAGSIPYPHPERLQLNALVAGVDAQAFVEAVGADVLVGRKRDAVTHHAVLRKDAAPRRLPAALVAGRRGLISVDPPEVYLDAGVALCQLGQRVFKVVWPAPLQAISAIPI